MLSKNQALQRLHSDIQLRGLSKSTLRGYKNSVEKFLTWCNKPIEEMDEMDVRRYLEALIKKRCYTPRTTNLHVAAIRFFFAVTLNRSMNYLQIPRMKVPKKLPEVLSKAEVAELIAQSANVKHKALMLTAYGSGLRVNELVCLKISDIDSQSMRLLVRGGKGAKDRYTLLSETALIALREYWQKYKPKNDENYLFPGSKNVGHLTTNAIILAIQSARSRTNISKSVSPHTLRHCFATHLLEDGYSLLQIKELLGHASIQSTTIYLHLANATQGVTSPADCLPEANRLL